MTQKVNPSQFRPAEAFKTAGAIGYAGGTSGGPQAGFVTSTPSEVAQVDPDITESALNSFAQSSSASSLTVTIDPGEAFVGGAWLCTDTSTTVSLQASTTGQTVFVGWDQTGTNEVVVGLAGAFASGSSDVDFRVPLFTFDTDGSGVTNVLDERRLDYSIDIEGIAHFGDNEQASIEFDGTDLAVSGADLSISDDLVTDSGETVWDSSSAEVPDSSLGSIDAPTINLGRGLENDGTGQIQFDEDTAYTFTSNQTFNAGLNVATGQSIEDGFGTNRLSFFSDITQVNNGEGEKSIELNNNNRLALFARSNEPIVFRDNDGGFNAVRYITNSTTPGTLELSNAVLDANEPAEFADYRDLEPSSEPSTPSGDTLRLWVDQTDGNYKAKDSAGDTVTLITTE